MFITAARVIFTSFITSSTAWTASSSFICVRIMITGQLAVSLFLQCSGRRDLRLLKCEPITTIVIIRIHIRDIRDVSNYNQQPINLAVSVVCAMLLKSLQQRSPQGLHEQLRFNGNMFITYVERRSCFCLSF